MDLETFKQEKHRLYFDNLKEYIGEKVVVEFVFTVKENPMIYKNIAVLKEIVPFQKVCTNGAFCPTMFFIGPEYTIIRITDKWGNVIFNNEAVLDHLPIVPNYNNLNNLSYKTFGHPYTSKKSNSKYKN